jgi:CheY-like chemotaxis protein
VPSLLRGDSGRLRQIVVNLANNAIKFTQDGEVSIWVSLVREDPCSATIRFQVMAEAVANGQEAVKALEMIPYDLVLMDVQMPEMDGLEATRLIRDPNSAVSNHHVPIIALTAHAMKGDRKKCTDAGMDDYTPKPIDS